MWRDLADRRRLWVLLFSLSGLPALFSAMVLPFNPPLAIPWVVLTWTIAALSGYRIWRIDHPSLSAGRTIARLLTSTLAFAVGAVVLLIIGTYPLVLVVVVVGWLVVMGLLGLALWAASKGVSEE